MSAYKHTCMKIIFLIIATYFLIIGCKENSSQVSKDSIKETSSEYIVSKDDQIKRTEIISEKIDDTKSDLQVQREQQINEAKKKQKENSKLKNNSCEEIIVLLTGIYEKLSENIEDVDSEKQLDHILDDPHLAECKTNKIILNRYEAIMEKIDRLY